MLDYVSQQAYASTAKVLSQPRPKRVTGDGVTGDGIGGSTTNGSSGHGGDDGGMDIDVTPGVGPGASSHPVNKDKEKERLITPSELESIERRRGESDLPTYAGQRIHSTYRSVALLIPGILNHILNGAIMRAIDSIQTHFPAVLDETSLPKPPPQAQPTSYASYQGSSSTAPPRRLGQVRQPAQPMAHSIPVNVQSTHPAHVMLNLKIQAFIERFRNNASSSPSTPSSSIESLTSSMHMSTEMTGQSGPPTLNLGSSVNKTSKLAADLTAVQDLHAFAKNLPADDRAVYLPELQWINSLFAYTDPETSILRGFLEQDRRIALAEQVNAAILGNWPLVVVRAPIDASFGGKERAGFPAQYRATHGCDIHDTERQGYRPQASQRGREEERRTGRRESSCPCHNWGS